MEVTPSWPLESNVGVWEYDRAAQKVPERDDRQTDGQTDRVMDIHTHTHTHTIRPSVFHCLCPK